MQIIHTKSRAAIALGIVLLAGTAWAGYSYVLPSSSVEKTLDAYVTADFTLVAPKVAGLIQTVDVEDNEAVKAGQILARIDDRDFQAALSSAEADVEAAKAEIANLDAEISRQPAVVAQASAVVRSDAAATTFARANAARYRNLSTDGAGTMQEQQSSIAQLAQSIANSERDSAALQTARGQLPILQAGRAKAVAALKRMEALRDQAKLNLSYTVIRAPIDGFVGRRSVRPGGYVEIGSTLLAIVPTAQAYVLANYQESQIGDMRLHQPATIRIDTFPELELHGHVDSLAPATDVAFAPIQPNNATGNFTKIVQRIPVKIVLDPNQENLKLLRVGMSVIPTVDVKAPGGAPVGTLKRAR
ncbi:HlyD family secretion protein [Novosphingobium resinovorum]|uniref:HlyD family secretion protein n=1 Tax=Novosphingobium resinovorum TaxID=158500 RepID=UPI002ED26931|nr:HlyD family secretion protein [Novosphingobium resinovorum]